MTDFNEIINIHEKAIGLPPHLHRLLRLGMVDKEELETVRRALKHPMALSNPLLRKHLNDLLVKMVNAVEDDPYIFRRLRDRVQKGKM